VTREIRQAVQNALISAKGTLSLAAHAQKIGVAPRVLSMLLGDPDKLAQEPLRSAKAEMGRAETLGRIYAYLVAADDFAGRHDQEDVVAAFGLDFSKSSVRQGWERALSAVPAVPPADPFVTHGDPTIERIVRGSDERPPNVVIAGILDWEPYTDRTLALEQTFAGKFMRRLLGSLDPSQWTVRLERLGFGDILTPEGLKNGTVDAIFSVYDLPSRRLAGFDFIRIPGLRAPLSALVFSDRRFGPMTWSTLLDVDATGDLRVFGVMSDASELLIRGVCRYPDDRVVDIAIDKNEGRDRCIAEKLLAEVADFEAKRKDFLAGKASCPVPFAFVGDATVVAEVEGLLRAVPRKNDPGSEEETGEPYDQGPVRLETITDVAIDDRRPSYHLGVAISANSPRWLSVLKDALVDELFGNAVAVTANSYAEMLAVPSEVEIDTLPKDWSAETRDIFTGKVWKRLRELAQDEDASERKNPARQMRIGKMIKQVEAMWQPPFAIMEAYR